MDLESVQDLLIAVWAINEISSNEKSLPAPDTVVFIIFNVAKLAAPAAHVPVICVQPPPTTGHSLLNL